MDYLEIACELAERGRGRVSPNPLVGAVLVREGEVVGRGWHARVGGPHAEVAAIQEAGEQARGATLYVTLEPCAHHGRTPPCVDAILQAGITRVVAGLKDPNPRVAGGGLEKLRARGLETEWASGPWPQRLARQNEVFLKFVRTGLPFVTMKYAMTLDGKIAAHTGHSQWISGPEARAWVHLQRGLSEAVMVGSGTVLADDPRLTARTEGTTKQPARVIVDRRGRTPQSARVYAGDGARRISVTEVPRPDLERRGVEIWPYQDLAHLMRALGDQELTSVLLEGGGTLNAAAVAAGQVDKVACFISPRLVGGAEAPTPLEGKGAPRVDQGWALQGVTWRQLGTDGMVEGYLNPPW